MAQLFFIFHKKLDLKNNVSFDIFTIFGSIIPVLFSYVFPKMNHVPK